MSPQCTLGLPAILLLLLATAAPSLGDDHGCFEGCPTALVSDATCRGAYSNSTGGHLSTECDWVVYDVAAPGEAANNTNPNWIVIHAGGCDTWTGEIGDWAYAATGSNLFGLRTCTGINPQSCTLNRSACDAIHISWTMPTQPPAMGLGFNPARLIDIADDPANSLVFLHEFDGLPTYPWSKVCSPTVPAYICIAADDPEFDRKFGGPQGIKATLEAGLGNSAYLQCAVEVIDARNSSATPGFKPGPVWPHFEASNRNASLPCSGIFPDIVVGNWQVEMNDAVTAALATEILLEGRAGGQGEGGGGGGDDGKGGALAALKRAIEVMHGTEADGAD